MRCWHFRGHDRRRRGFPVRIGDFLNALDDQTDLVAVDVRDDDGVLSLGRSSFEASLMSIRGMILPRVYDTFGIARNRERSLFPGHRRSERHRKSDAVNLSVDKKSKEPSSVVDIAYGDIRRSVPVLRYPLTLLPWYILLSISHAWTVIKQITAFKQVCSTDIKRPMPVFQVHVVPSRKKVYNNGGHCPYFWDHAGYFRKGGRGWSILCRSTSFICFRFLLSL